MQWLVCGDLRSISVQLTIQFCCWHCPMARRKQAPKDLTGIRQREGKYQVLLTGSAEDEDAAIKLRDKFRRQVAEAQAARTTAAVQGATDFRGSTGQLR
jgi:hypothetical protein